MELLVGGALDIFFIPVKPGEYEFKCTIPLHEDLGMHGSILVTGGEGYDLDLEVSPEFDLSLSSDERTSGSHDVWASAVETELQLLDFPDGSMAFSPSTLELDRGTGYRIRFVSPEPNRKRHHFSATEFYRTLVTRKIEDSQAEIKVPYLDGVELFPGGEAELFAVPTVSGTYDTTCPLPGHHEAGMFGQFVVR